MKRLFALCVCLCLVLACPAIAYAADTETMYSYNGVVLPALPDVDSEQYPYMQIHELDLLPGYYNLAILGKGSYYFELDGARYFGGSADNPVPGYSSASYKAPFTSWGTLNLADNMNISADDNSMTTVVWSNFDILNADGTVFFSASEPVPVSNAVVGIKVTAAQAELYLNDEVQMYATVTGTGSYSNSVIWSIDTSVTDSSTVISDDGLLTVGSVETVPYLVVRATSADDSSISGTLLMVVNASERTETATKLDDVEAALDENTQKLEEVKDSVDDVKDSVDAVQDTLDGSEDDVTDATEFRQSADEDVDEFNDAMDALDSMTEPNYEDIDASFDDIFTSDGIDEAIDAIGVFFENEYIHQVFFIAFMLALVSFVIFGKR